MNTTNLKRLGVLVLILAPWPVLGDVNLLQHYPTSLTTGDTEAERARAWDFSGDDVFRVNQFHFKVEKNLSIDTGEASLGIGHSVDGAVWAVLIPQAKATLASSADKQPEAVASVWLRFHPAEIAHLFPPETVFKHGAAKLAPQMRAIANVKMNSSWQAGGRAMIPEPKDLTVDCDTANALRRFFIVDTQAGTAEYVDAFVNDAVPQPPAFSKDLGAQAFDQLWEAFDEKYAMFVLRPEVDWAKLREQYRDKALASQSAYEFADVCAEMLRPLRDLHIWMTVAGANVPVFNRPRSANFNFQGCKAILHRAALEGREKQGVAWVVTTNQVGFIGIAEWNDQKVPGLCDEALEHMRDTRGLIVDVRMNGGGSEPLAEKFAARFLEKEFVYAHSQFRNGPKHTELTEKYDRSIAPRGPWRYNRPVLLLIGQKCMSSCESFVGMMTGDPLVTTMGDHTCGSSGNPEIINLPLDIMVSVPKWIDYLPDGTPLDERGFQPQIPFHPDPGAFDGNRDDLLSAALARLSKEPLPAKAIDGPAVESSTGNLPDHSVDMREEAHDKSRPHVVSVTPTNNAVVAGGDSQLRVRFDRPMDPLSLKLDWESGGFLDCEFPEYNPDTYEFTIPVHLAPGMLHQIVVNQVFGGGEDLAADRKRFPRQGFLSTNNQLAGMFVWRFRTKATPIPERRAAPHATSISPASGSQTGVLTTLEIQFDQPMAPPEEASPCLISDDPRKGPLPISKIEYDAVKHLFRIPLVLPPKENVALTLGQFRSADGVPASPIALRFQVTDDDLTREQAGKASADAKDPRLLALLETMKQKRMQLTSLAERVQTLSLAQNEGLFHSLRSDGATFKWQKPDQYYGDATGPMGMCLDFRLGSDGQRWWWHGENVRSGKFIVCPAKEMKELNVTLDDPFDLTELAPSNAAVQLKLKYAGPAPGGAANCVQVESWRVERIGENIPPYGSCIQWRIDPEAGRPLEMADFGEDYVIRMRFLYDAVNTPLSSADFAVPDLPGIRPSAPKPLEDSQTRRFINLSDGSDGRMSVRWGEKSSGSTSSSGLN